MGSNKKAPHNEAPPTGGGDTAQPGSSIIKDSHISIENQHVADPDLYETIRALADAARQNAEAIQTTAGMLVNSRPENVYGIYVNAQREKDRG